MNKANINFPVIDQHNLVTQDVDAATEKANAERELLIYNLETNRVFCLNKTAALVFDACAKQSEKEQQSIRENEFQSIADFCRAHPDFSPELVYATLDELSEAGFFATKQRQAYASPNGGVSRREVFKRAALTSIAALPVITALTAPRAAQAASARTCTTRCVPAFQNVCAGCTTAITYNLYASNDGTCTGVTATNQTSNCTSGTLTGPIDALITSVA